MVTETYLKGNSLFHRIDPRIKLFFLLFISIFFFVPLPVFKYYTVIMAIFASGIYSTGLKDILTPVKVIAPLLILIIILTPPFHADGTVYIAIKGRPFLTSAGLIESFHLVGRFLGITLLFYLFLRTTRIEDFILSLRFFGLSYKISLMISLTVRYIPYLSSIYEGTLDAHKMRLTPQSPYISKWNFPSRFKKLLSVLTSVLIQAVKSIPSLAMALETRGVGRKNLPGQTKKMKSLKELRKELILSFPVILIIIIFSLS
ncbi:MAG: energy-coupling factor transporter transmembrane component T [Spirochaetia bacterium]|jgi:energy-coupling factor transport system permease protein|nr:energy-coupling factor transporter transmembrane component T [Spirochaetia bacterium]